MKLRVLIFIAVLNFVGCSESERRDAFPIILQKEPMECGPVCLQMCTEFYDGRIGLKQLTELTQMDDTGTSLLALSNAADSIGFEKIACKLSVEKLINDVPLPAIVHWNENHFVVVYNVIDGKEIWVADPAKGKIKYTKEEFCTHWIVKDSTQGIALLLELTDRFKQVN
jgi:ATP-binding cassette, subfamily B, bacterial